MSITRITNERAMELTGAILPCPALANFDARDGSPALDRLNLRVAAMLSLADLHEHHNPGAGELDIPRGYAGPRRIMPPPRTHAHSVMAGLSR